MLTIDHTLETALSGLAALLITGAGMVSLLVTPPGQPMGQTDHAPLALPILA